MQAQWSALIGTSARMPIFRSRRHHGQAPTTRELKEIGFGTARSMLGCGMPIANFFTACQELIVQSIDLARLIGRDILQMQGSQLMLGWLVIATIVNRPWSFVKLRSVLCTSGVCQQ